MVYWVALAVIVVVIGVTLYKFRASADWPSVPGHVVESRVVEVRKGPSTGGADARYMQYEAIVAYRYEVDGKAYTTNRVMAFGRNIFDLRDTAEAFAADYPEGATVTVHYNPASPSEAYLITAKHLPVVPIVLIVLMALVVLAILIGALLVMSGQIDLDALLANVKRSG